MSQGKVYVLDCQGNERKRKKMKTKMNKNNTYKNGEYTIHVKIEQPVVFGYNDAPGNTK